MEKRKYINPSIEEVRLDNEISLQLASNPTEPGEGWTNPGGATPAPSAMKGAAESDPYQYDNW